MLDSSDVRKMNLNLIRKELWRGGEHTKQTVARNTGLSVATCNTLLNELEASGEAISEKRQLNGVGRSTSIYRINEGYESVLCIRFDLKSDGNRVLQCDVLSMLGTRLFQGEKQYRKLEVEMIAAEIQEILPQFPNISCVLIGTNGIVDNGRIRMTDISELEGVNLAESVSKVVQGLPTYMAYDCQYRAYGAYMKEGYTKETLTLFYCVKNVLPGSASVVAGKIINGNNGFAGMTGYMPCNIERSEQIRMIAEEPSGLMILAKSVVSLVAVLNPDKVVFAGNVVDEEVLEQIQEECKRYLPNDFLPKLCVAEAGGDPYYLDGMYHMALEMKVDMSASG